MTRCGFTVRASASRLYGGTVVSTRRADVQPAATGDVSSLPLAPKNPLPYRQRLAAVRSFHTGMDKLRDAGGPVTRVSLGPRWLIPPIVVAASPQAIRDVLSVRDGSFDRRAGCRWSFVGSSAGICLTCPMEVTCSRRRTLQPVFAKQSVGQFGGHMVQAAEAVCATWGDDTRVDLDVQCRTVTLRALGRSVLGLDLDERADAVAQPLRDATSYAVTRAISPLRAPKWMPTRARRRAYAAAATIRELADAILQACRAYPTRDAPLVHALIAATDPETWAIVVRQRDPRRVDHLFVRGPGHYGYDVDVCVVGAG